MTHLSEEELILIYYGETAAPKHLLECAECGFHAESLARTLNLCDGWVVPEGPRELERSVWARIAPEMERPEKKGLRWPAWTVAFAALLIAAFVLGRVTMKPVVMTGLSAQARERILQISLADHLDRTGMLLTEISNVNDIDAAERERAQDLVEEGRLMRQTLTLRKETGTTALMDEVERFMLEVANSSSTAGELQQRISSESLLFKVRIIESNLRTRGTKL